METDYLVVGGGAAAMAFVDALISDCDADVIIVEKRDRPGGHWNDAYPYARLHQPSAYYGVNSLSLGRDRIDESGRNKGMYERARASEVADYYQAVLEDQLLPTGQVRFLSRSELYDWGGHGWPRIRSVMTGRTSEVKVRQKIVDARYLEASIPSRHRRPFEVEPGATVVSPNELVELSEAPSGYVILGAGKTAMDTCIWLLDQGVRADDITWIRPNDVWIMNRRVQQPYAYLPDFLEYLVSERDIGSKARTLDELFKGLEELGQLMRIDRNVEPALFRQAILSRHEVEELRTIENVVRLGRVASIERRKIDLETGTIETDPKRVHIDCTAVGPPTKEPRPIFTEEVITPQPVRLGQIAFSAALTGFVEATRTDVNEQNTICPANKMGRSTSDWLRAQLVNVGAEAAWSQRQDVSAWIEAARLNMARGVSARMSEPRIQHSVERLGEVTPRFADNLGRLLMQLA